MDSKVCENLVPYGLNLYQMLIDSTISPVIHILSGEESEEEIQQYFEEAGFSCIQETVVMGLALNGTDRQVVLIRASAMHSTYHFLQTLWHELGHFSFRENNPGLFFDLMSDPARLWFCPMMQGIVMKFWDEAVAQSAANRVLQHLPEESMNLLCPDAGLQIEAEHQTMQYFLKTCINRGQVDFDVPLLSMLKIPFSPYCLAIYCAEAAANPWNDQPTNSCTCEDCACDMQQVGEPILDLVEMVRKLSLSESPFVLSEDLLDKTAACFVKLSESLGADEEDLEWMHASLADVMFKVRG